MPLSLARTMKTIIIGAGPSGIFAARQLVKGGVPASQIRILEKEPRIGGKCLTFSDPHLPKLKTELGACIVLSNYEHIWAAIREKNIQTENLLPCAHEGIPINEALDKKSVSGLKISGQLFIYQRHVSRYRAHPSPEFDLPFVEYAIKHGMPDLPVFFEHFVAGFGYGPMHIIPTHSIFDYIGRSVVMDIIAAKVRNPIVTIHGGFQHFMERLAEDFNVTTSAQITKVDRSPEGVQVEFNVNGKHEVETADNLILAIPPLQWPSLNMELTALEKSCLENMKYYRYVVAACHVKHMRAEHRFLAPGLNPDNFKKNLGELALITLRDAREPVEERLVTFYQNSGQRNYYSPPVDEKAERKVFEDKIHQFERETGCEVTIESYKAWQDYFTDLPFQIRNQIDKELWKTPTRTLPLGSFMNSGFENLESVARVASNYVDKYIFCKNPRVTPCDKLRHALTFFTNKPVPPVGQEKKPEARLHRSLPCTIL